MSKIFQQSKVPTNINILSCVHISFKINVPHTNNSLPPEDQQRPPGARATLWVPVEYCNETSGSINGGNFLTSIVYYSLASYPSVGQRNEHPPWVKWGTFCSSDFFISFHISASWSLLTITNTFTNVNSQKQTGCLHLENLFHFLHFIPSLENTFFLS
jgi:hypothetical protein